MKMQSNHDCSISLIRFIATVFIIMCHIMQYLDHELAWWLNVGVQIFLCMSGFLYGKRDPIADDLNFYRKNAQKILIDYYVVVIAVILVQVIFCPEELSLLTMMKALLTYGTLSGGGHLWYIPYCLLCYLITPFLSRCFSAGKSRRTVRDFLILSVLVIVVTETFVDYFNSAWIFCYLLGFLLGRISINGKGKLYRNLSFLIVAAAILSNSVQIIQDYIIKIELSGMLAVLYPKFTDYAHVALGAALFVVFKAVFSRVFKKGCPNWVKKICSCSDQYSYDVYLVHQFLISGPFSLMAVTKTMGINLVLVIAAVIFGTVLVNFVSACIRNRITALMAMRRTRQI